MSMKNIEKNILKGVIMVNKEIIRRSISMPKELDEKIGIMAKQFSYSVKNQLMIELLELGVLKYQEDVEMKQLITQLIKKVDKVCNMISNDR